MIKYTGDKKEIAKALQKKAREETKEYLLKDILMDINVCKVEGWDYKEYINELYDLIIYFVDKKQ